MAAATALGRDTGASVAAYDDLATALLDHPQTGMPGWDAQMLRPVLGRACAILEQALAGRRDRPPVAIDSFCAAAERFSVMAAALGEVVAGKSIVLLLGGWRPCSRQSLFGPGSGETAKGVTLGRRHPPKPRPGSQSAKLRPYP